MKVGRYRRGRRHGLRQPEVEGKLRAFGECAQQHQAKRNEVLGVTAQLLAGGQHMVEVVTAGDMTDEQHPSQHAQAAGAGHGQCHAGAPPCVAPVVPVAD